MILTKIININSKWTMEMNLLGFRIYCHFTAIFSSIHINRIERHFEFSAHNYVNTVWRSSYKNLYDIYISLHCECQLHYWSSSRASYHLQGKYRLVTYLPTILHNTWGWQLMLNLGTFCMGHTVARIGTSCWDRDDLS